MTQTDLEHLAIISTLQALKTISEGEILVHFAPRPLLFEI